MMIMEHIPMSPERKHRLVSIPLARYFLAQFAHILDDKCAWCGKPIRASDFIDDEDRSFYFMTGYCPICQAKWRVDIASIERRLGIEPYWSVTSFDTKTRNGS